MEIKQLISYLRNEDDSFLITIREDKNLSINKIQKLISKNPEVPVRDILTLIKLQNKIADKVRNAEKYIFTSKGAEQCSSSLIADYHATKLEMFDSIADLCCGNGIDLKAMAVGKSVVYAVDLDEETLETARYNCEVDSLETVEFIQDKAEDFAKEVDVIFSDPDRRGSGSRVVKAEEMSPPLSAILALDNSKGNFMIKLAPALDYKSIRLDIPHTWEFVSENGTLKEILLCTGKLATSGVPRKSILLPRGEILQSSNALIDVSEIKKFIIEPDPAIIRANLVGELGEKLEYNLLDKHIALLTGSEAVETNLGKLFQVEFEMNYNLKHLKKYLRDNDVGEIVIKTRGFPETVEQFRKKFKLKGNLKKLMFIVRIGSGHRVIFATPIINSVKT